MNVVTVYLLTIVLYAPQGITTIQVDDLPSVAECNRVEKIMLRIPAPNSRTQSICLERQKVK